MSEAESAAAVVTLPAWSVTLERVGGPRPWRFDVFSSDNHACDGQPDRAACHLADADVSALAATVLHPPRAEEPAWGRARLVRDGFGLLLRLLVAPVEGEAGLVVHVQEHHRAGLLEDIGRVRPDLIPTATPPEPRLCLDTLPDTGLTLDQATQLHERIGRWLDSEGIRAAFADRLLRRRVFALTAGGRPHG
ncbi:hypothetical protein [Embleya sp. MST-111070]|uniref:hypothetical protein n=1 Tax=Embleya sp. MST-111070 TaxID=3398231 RepID=UPI003F7367ED